ncbi:MAG: hypothetical protein A4S09_03880 [Proteobacteria bacterium SG_bin7]|nr:MAG: hypothetical protein A4S09_03880 [Proteobacteria bacterium SG_bin7]
MRAIREKLHLAVLLLTFPILVIVCTFASWLAIILATIESFINPVPNPEKEPPISEKQHPSGTPTAS